MSTAVHPARQQEIHQQSAKADHDDSAIVSNATSARAARAFFEGFDPIDWQNLPERTEHLCQALNDWTSDHASLDILCPFADSSPAECRRIALTASIMTQSLQQPYFYKTFQKYFSESLKRRKNCYENEEDFEEDQELQFFANLRTLGWIRATPGGLLEDTVTRALKRHISSVVKTSIEGVFDQDNCLEPLETDYKSAVLLPWLSDVIGIEENCMDGNGSESQKQSLSSAKVQFWLEEAFCNVRSKEIFDLIADYPDSHPAATELHRVLTRTDMFQPLAAAMREALTRRLNHPGANTSQIIDVYISTIKVLREIDPSDLLLGPVTKPVRAYLRQRHDTIRCIITSLTDSEMGGDLYEELRRQDARPLEEMQVDSEDEEEMPTMDWKPPPPLSQTQNAFFAKGSQVGGGSGGDILAMLISIYGSKELFVNEYRSMLADKLLANLDFHTDEEVHTLELLKLRFGEVSMRDCEIMIKDTEDSKRILTNIRDSIQSKTQQHRSVVDAAIVSHIFWPSLDKESLTQHPRIQAQLDEFSREYGQLKNPRRLQWYEQLGTVELELDLVDPDGQIETRSFTCAPLLATLISHFEDKSTWTTEGLSEEMGVPQHVIEKRIGYWVQHKVLILKQRNVYELASVAHLLDPTAAAASSSSNQAVPAPSIPATVVEESPVDWPRVEGLVVAMLRNLGELSVDKIHENLQLYAGPDYSTVSAVRLAGFLKDLRSNGTLELGPDGMYTLKQ